MKTTIATTLCALLFVSAVTISFYAGKQAGRTEKDDAAFSEGYRAGVSATTVDKGLVQEAEYVRVVNAVADAYGYDPSEVETDAGLVDGLGNIKR